MNRLPKCFQPRPLLCLAACSALGILLGTGNLIPWPLWLILCAGLPLILLLPAAKNNMRKTLLPALAVAVMGLYAARAGCMPHVPEMERTKTLISGTAVEQPKEKNGRLEVTLNQAAAQNTPLTGQVILRLYGNYQNIALARGQQIQIQATLYTPDVQRNEGGFDARQYYRLRGITYVAYATLPTQEKQKADSPTLLIQGAPSKDLQALAQNARQSLSRIIDGLWPNHGPLMKGLLLGDSSELEADVVAFRRSGIAHLLAVSGLHVGYVALCMRKLFEAIGGPRALRYGGLCVGLLIYSVLTGLSPSVLRASAMAAVYALAPLVNRKADSPSTWAAAFLLVLLFRPGDLFATGFQLSFGAVAGITLMQPTISRLTAKVPGFVGSGLSVSLGAQLGVIPFLAKYFGQFSLIGLVVNIVAVPIAGLVVLVGWIGVIVGGIGQSLSLPMNGLQGILAVGPWLLSTIADKASQVSWASVRLPYPHVEWMIASFLAMIMASRFFLIKGRKQALALALCAALALTGSGIRALTRFKGLTIDFVDVGQGDSSLITTNDNRRYLIDAGSEGSPAGQVAWHKGLRLNGVFITHPHEDHFGGMQGVLDWQNVGCVYLPAGYAQMAADAGFDALLARIAGAGVEMVELYTGDVVQLNQTTHVQVLASGGTNPDVNECGLVLKLVYGGRNALFMGDAGFPTEASLTMNQPCEVLKVGHHGSNGSSSQDFLADVQPKIALIGVGRNNRYGHPTPETMERLAAVQALVRRTDESGMITVFISPDGEIQVKPFLNQPVRQ